VTDSRAGAPTTIDVLGLTLFSAWPVALEPQLQNEEIRNCVINLYLIDTAFAQKTPQLFRAEWLRDMESKPKEIAAFLEENAERLQRNRVEVRLKPYAFFPGVHGFRTSDGHLMISFVHWAKQALDNPNQFYEIFLPPTPPPAPRPTATCSTTGCSGRRGRENPTRNSPRPLRACRAVAERKLQRCWAAPQARSICGRRRATGWRRLRAH